MRKNSWLSFSLLVVCICAGFAGILVSSMAYMAKDFNAYNSVYAFFGVSRNLQLELTRLPVDKFALLRLLNLSQILLLFCSVMFSLLFAGLLPRKAVAAIRWTVAVLAVVQLVFMDPGWILWVYFKNVGPFTDIFFFRGFYRILSLILRLTGIAQVLFSAGMLLAALFSTPRSLRGSVALVALIFGGIAFVYLFLYGWLPTQVMWLSRVAHYVSFDSLPVNRPTQLNAYMSFLSGLFIVGFFVVAWRYLWKTTRAKRSDLAFRRKVSAVDMVSRIFCHYLKNELLSQQAELKLLSARVDPSLQGDVTYIMNRNDEIYQRLSAVRETMKQRKLPMEKLNLLALIQSTVSQFSWPEQVQLTQTLPEGPVMVYGNPYQLQEVMECLLHNALEALEDAEPPRRIRLQVFRLRRMVNISVANNGAPIARKNWDAIFDPFFTTKPAKSNWGLGLALSKSIVSLHHGRIWVDEESDKGVTMTVFHIVLHQAG